MKKGQMHKTLYSIVVTEKQWNILLRHFDQPDERMAFGYCGMSSTDGDSEFLLRDIDCPGAEEYRSQSPFGISLRAEHVVQRVIKAREHAAFLDLHSHPFTEYPAPSGIDDAGATVQLRVLRDLAPGVILVRLVLGRGESVWAEVAGARARTVDSGQPGHRTRIHALSGRETRQCRCSRR